MKYEIEVRWNVYRGEYEYLLTTISQSGAKYDPLAIMDKEAAMNNAKHYNIDMPGEPEV